MRPIFMKTLYDSRKLMLWMFIGYALYGMMISGMYPSMIKAAEGYNELVETMPELLSFFGLDAETFNMANLGNFLHLEMMIWLLIIAGVVAIYHAFNAFTNAERNHTMEMLLSLPLSRRDNLIGQFAATVVLLVVTLSGAYLGLIVLTPLWKDVEFSVVEIAVAVFAAILPLLVITSFSYLLNAVVPSSKRFAGAVAYVFWVGSYLVFGLTLAISSLSDFQPFFIYHYYNAGELMNKGINLGYWAILLVLAALLFAAAWWRVDKKELGV